MTADPETIQRVWRSVKSSADLRQMMCGCWWMAHEPFAAPDYSADTVYAETARLIHYQAVRLGDPRSPNRFTVLGSFDPQAPLSAWTKVGTIN